MSDDKLQDAIYRAGRAEGLLKDELLWESFEYLEREYLRELLATRRTEGDAREKLYLSVNVIRDVRKHLMDVLSNGKLARRELDEMLERKRLGRPPKAA